MQVKEPLSDDDYYARNPEFSTWLLEECRIHFSDLPSDKAHELFSGFVQVWNAGRLPAKYYAGVVAAPIKRTTHTWAFKGGAAGAVGRTAGNKGMAAFMADQKDRLVGENESISVQL